VHKRWLWLTRRFRLLEKKRGSRRTVSPAAAIVLEAGFFGALFLVGATGTALFAVSSVTASWPTASLFPEVSFHQVTAEVISARLESLDEEGRPVAWRPQVQLRYPAPGNKNVRGDPATQGEDRFLTAWTYEGTEEYLTDKEAVALALAAWEPGQTVTAYYDPRDPSRITTSIGSRLVFWLTLMVAASFAAIGGAGFVLVVRNVGASAERLAALAGAADSGRAPDEKGADPASNETGADADPIAESPGLPTLASFRDSPGVRLAYRLPAATHPGWSLVAWFSFCLVWNALVVVFVVVALDRHVRGRPDWLLSLVSAAAVGIGLWSIYLAFRRLLLATGIGPTTMEVSEHPVLLGGAATLVVAQYGQLTIRDMRARVECHEIATYEQGTNVRTERVKVFEEELLSREELTVSHRAPWEGEMDLRLPATAMHSLQTAHNGIAWSVVVEGVAVGWSAFERRFPIIVYPAEMIENARGESAAAAARRNESTEGVGSFFRPSRKPGG